MLKWCKRKHHEQKLSNMIPRLYSIAYSWGCNQDVCDDLVQETVTTALDKYKQLRDPSAINCWVIRILVNAHRQHLRKQRWLTNLDDDEPIHEFGPAQIMEAERTVDRVRTAISLLSDEHRKVLVLIDMEGLSYREVAEVLDLKLGTVMSRLGRARVRLKKFLLLESQTDKNDSQQRQVRLRSVK